MDAAFSHMQLQFPGGPQQAKRSAVANIEELQKHIKPPRMRNGHCRIYILLININPDTDRTFTKSAWFNLARGEKWKRMQI